MQIFLKMPQRVHSSQAEGTCTKVNGLIILGGSTEPIGFRALHVDWGIEWKGKVVVEEKRKRRPRKCVKLACWATAVATVCQGTHSRIPALHTGR
jgi:hypothetical protein